MKEPSASFESVVRDLRKRGRIYAIDDPKRTVSIIKIGQRREP